MATAVCLKKERQCKKECLRSFDQFPVEALSERRICRNGQPRLRSEICRYSTLLVPLNDFACRRTSTEIMVMVSYMIRRDYLVVGGGIGGASACEGIR